VNGREGAFVGKEHLVSMTKSCGNFDNAIDRTAPYMHPVCVSAIKKHLAINQVLYFLFGDAGFEPTAFGSGDYAWGLW
jgi:hypothetical protein